MQKFIRELGRVLRLSLNIRNLQNLPSTGNKYAKLIKECFQAPQGWLFVGLDYNSLEDYISALTTKDPNKLRVYEEKFDGHCLRAAYYFADQMEGIDLNSPESVNSIKKKYPDLRQESKAPTFALTYQGTWSTLVKNLGMPEEKAKAIEANYHELYKVSDQWVQTRIDEAAQCGYAEVAFGLRVRTPLLHQVVLGNSKTPHEAAAEGRTVGNAFGQSYGLLNTRAGVEFMQKVRTSEYRLDIKPSAHIHDAQYFLVRDDLELLEWMNEHLVKAVQWQELPEIQHDTVKLGGDLSIFYPTWKDEIEIYNNASQEEIKEILQKEAIKRKS
jgi:DNA polymerase-1